VADVGADAVVVDVVDVDVVYVVVVVDDDVVVDVDDDAVSTGSIRPEANSELQT